MLEAYPGDPSKPGVCVYYMRQREKRGSDVQRGRGETGDAESSTELLSTDTL